MSERRIPPELPSDQLLYWSRDWQDGERESLEELARGEGRVFRTVEEARAWLEEADGE